MSGAGPEKPAEGAMVMVPRELLIRARHIVGDRAAGGRMTTSREDASRVWNDLLSADITATQQSPISGELERADRIIGWMANHIGKMCPPENGLFDLNEHWLFMQRNAPPVPSVSGEGGR